VWERVPTPDKMVFRYKDVNRQDQQQGFIVGWIMQDKLFEGAQPRIFVTNPNNLEEGRTFVWAKARWYERLEGEMGNVLSLHSPIQRKGCEAGLLRNPG
jgi:hypothetical protein